MNSEAGQAPLSPGIKALLSNLTKWLLINAVSDRFKLVSVCCDVHVQIRLQYRSVLGSDPQHTLPCS